MYLDSAYIAKYYVNEIDSSAVRRLVHTAATIYTSAWAQVEVTAAFHRHMREGALSPTQGQDTHALFQRHIEEGFWAFVPITDTLLRSTAIFIRGLPPNLPLRAGDALHIASALSVGEETLYTNDRHLLRAASHFGLNAQSVTVATD